MKKLLTYCLFIGLAVSLKAQILPVRDLYLKREIEKSSVSSESKTHSSFRNHYFSDYKDVISPETQYSNMFTLIKDTSKNSRLFIMPAFEMMFGKDITNANESLSYFRLGTLIDYSFKEKFAISLMPYFSSYKLPYHLQYILMPYGSSYFLNEMRDNNSIVPEYKILYRPFEFLTLELANGKNSFGDGYRSFLLSENAFNYNYFKLETQFLDIKYYCVWSMLMDEFIAPDMLWGGLVHNYRTKFAVFHYLDWNITNRFNVGFFEAIVMKDSNFFSYEYMNPIIFFRPVEFNLGSEDNALLGTNIRFSINKTSAVYGQFMLDDIIVEQLINDIKHRVNPDYTGEYGWFANKWAAQLGYKAYDMFKVDGLDFFTEVNIARPYIYSHVNPDQNYSHWHQSLAHPLGANFYESVSGVSYLHEKFKIDFKIMYAQVGMDTTDTHFGQNIFQPTMDGNQGYPYQVSSYYNTILQGNKTDILTARLDISYFPIKNRLLSVNAGVLFRNYSPEIGETETCNYFYIGLRSNIFNKKMLY